MHLWGRALALLLVFVPPAAYAQEAARETPSCRAWRECETLALEAEDRGEFDTFHELAWRTMQTRGTQDPEVMLMLARAQTLAGRPQDALVMLRRLTELGAAPKEALTGEAFARVRALRDWPELEARLTGTLLPPDAGATSAPSSTDALGERALPPEAAKATPTARGTAAPPPALTGISSAAVSPRPALVPEDLLPVGIKSLVPAGLAYDSVSGRVLVGNRTGRSVITISERLKTSMDLVRASSAGFREVLAIAIDVRQGDLWVASAAPEGSSATDQPGAALHKLQLVSGRPLTTIPLDVGDRPARFCGLAVTRNGDVFVLDAAAGRLWKLSPGQRTASLVRTLDVRTPAGFAVDAAGRHAYVSHENGLARLTLADGSLTPVSASADASVAGLEELIWHDGALIALERQTGAPSRLLRLRLNGRGTSVVRVDVLDPEVSTCGGRGAATTSGADVYYLAGHSAETGGDCSLVVRRVRMK